MGAICIFLVGGSADGRMFTTDNPPPATISVSDENTVSGFTARTIADRGHGPGPYAYYLAELELPDIGQIPFRVYLHEGLTLAEGAQIFTDAMCIRGPDGIARQVTMGPTERPAV